MSNLFLRLLNISITAGWIVLVVVLLRFVLKKAPKWTRVALWGLVALRLILPVSIESVTSLVPSAETVKIESVTAPVLTSVNEYNGVSYFYKNVRGEQIVLQSGFPTLNSAVNPTPEEAAEHFDTVTVLKTVAGWVWLAGIVGMLFYALISFLRLKHRVRASVLLEKGVYVCDEISDPFILGLIVPKIYLPSGMDEQTRAYVLAHEKAHLSRFDHIWKPLGFLLLSVYWFNPLLWLAYILLCRDIELACDEKVVKELDDAGKAAYSEALVTASVSRRSIAACPLAFGETGVKSRVKSVLSYKKPAFWIILVAILACVAVAVCFLTMPKKNQPDAAELVGTWELSAMVADDREVSPGYYIDEGTGSETFTLRADGTGSWVSEYINPGITTYTIAFTYTISGNELTFSSTEGPSSTLDLVYDSKKDMLSIKGPYITRVFHRVERDAAASDPTPDQLSGIWKTDGDSFGENRFLYGSLVLDQSGSAKLDLSTGSGPALQKEYTFALNKHYVCLSTDEGSVYGLYDPKTDTIFLPFKHSRSLSFTRTDDPVSSVFASPASAAQPLLGIWELVWMESTRTDAAVEEKQEEGAGSGMPFIATFPEEYELFYSGQKEYTMLLYENGTGDLLIQSGYSTAYATVHFDTDEQTIDQAGLDLYLHYHFDGDQLILDGDGFRVGFKRFDFISPSAAFASSSAEVLQWLDYYESSSDMPWDGTKEITHDAFPNVTFRWTAGSVEAVENGKTRTLFTGMPIWNVFFTDVTGDGKPELCASVSFGSGIVDEHIVVYDYANRQSYTLWDRGTFDYHLYTDNGALYVGKTQCNSFSSDTSILDTGTLMMHDGVLCCRWSDGSVSVLNRELHESELYGEWLVEEEKDANGNVLYTFDVASTWKEYNFRNTYNSTVTYNETVPISSDYEKAFGHPVDYRYAVYDNYVHIEDSRSCTGYYDAQTQKLKLNYQPSPGQYVYATLRRMGEDITDAPTAEVTPEPSPVPLFGSWTPGTGYHKIEPMGTVPEVFHTMIDQNLFRMGLGKTLQYTYGFTDRVLTYSPNLQNDTVTYTISFDLYDLYGTLLLHAETTLDPYFQLESAIATTDGGIVFAVSFTDRSLDDGTWASEHYDKATAYIIKIGADGKQQWKTALPTYTGWALGSCIEYDGAYFFFGNYETPEQKQLGIVSSSNISIIKIGYNGTILKQQELGGDDFDTVSLVDTDADGFILYADTQNSKGEFAASRYWKMLVDDDLNVIRMEPVDEYGHRFARYLGVVQERRVFTDDPRYFHYSDGSITCVLDYGAFTLVVSENDTGIYENQPKWINMTWNYTETVYAAYDLQGNLLWKTAVDSSPDYDALATAYYAEP